MLVECSRKKQVVVSLLNDHTLFFLFDVACLTAFLSALIISCIIAQTCQQCMVNVVM
jgi:hypothetical protein